VTTRPQYTGSSKTCSQVSRTLETLVCPGQVSRAYFYWVPCQHGFSALDELLELAASRIQFDVLQAAAKLVAEVPYETAHVLSDELTGMSLGTAQLRYYANSIEHL
jgi:hypothetical protein